jgi:hypothetical protein
VKHAGAAQGDCTPNWRQSPLPVRDATSNYLVNQLYANVDVAGELKSRLPPQLQPLAVPISGALRNAATTAAQKALAAPRVQDAWKQANKAADQTSSTSSTAVTAPYR